MYYNTRLDKIDPDLPVRGPMKPTQVPKNFVRLLTAARLDYTAYHCERVENCSYAYHVSMEYQIA
jgi:hypothetical protein